MTRVTAGGWKGDGGGSSMTIIDEYSMALYCTKQKGVRVPGVLPGSFENSDVCVHYFVSVTVGV